MSSIENEAPVSLRPRAVLARSAPPAERARLARRARRLSWASLAWLGVEGGLGIVAGALASSVALVAFGLDSGIEALASVAVIWRFTASRTASEGAERRAQRVVAVSFFLLAPYVAVEAVLALADGTRPSTSWLGIAIAAGSLLICPWLGVAKRRVGERLNSEATKGEGRQNQLCALLAAAVLVGLGANAAFGLWWFDPAVALVIAAACVVEGRRSWRGEDCGCGACAASPDLAAEAATTSLVQETSG